MMNSLLALYNSTMGNKWTNNSGWGTDSVCLWYGVGCNEQGDIERLVLKRNNLVGTLPAAFFTSLPELTTLHLYSNKLEGSIPNEIKLFTKLADIQLSFNNFSGTLDPFWSLRNLKFLDAQYNPWTGNISPSIKCSQRLVALYLRNTKLGGSLPPEIGDLRSLSQLILSNNRLTGAIPNEIGGMKSLTQLWAQNNSLNGSIPRSLLELPNLTEVNLAQNQLTGGVARLNESRWLLRSLILAENQLEVELGNLLSYPTLQAVNLSLNKAVTGDVTTTLAGLRQLVFFSVSGNRLHHEADTLDIVHPSLHVLDVTNCHLNGIQLRTLSFPDSGIGVAHMRGNNFLCPLPPSSPYLLRNVECKVPMSTFMNLLVFVGSLAALALPGVCLLTENLGLRKKIFWFIKLMGNLRRMITVPLNCLFLVDLIRFHSQKVRIYCELINSRDIFKWFMPLTYFFQGGQQPPESTHVTWEAFLKWMKSLPVVNNEKTNVFAFKSLCQSFKMCVYSELGCESMGPRLPPDDFKMLFFATAILSIILIGELFKCLGLAYIHYAVRYKHRSPSPALLFVSTGSLFFFLVILRQPKMLEVFKRGYELCPWWGKALDFTMHGLLGSVSVLLLSVGHSQYCLKMGLALEFYIAIVLNALGSIISIGSLLTTSYSQLKKKLSPKTDNRVPVNLAIKESLSQPLLWTQ